MIQRVASINTMPSTIAPAIQSAIRRVFFLG